MVGMQTTAQVVTNGSTSCDYPDYDVDEKLYKLLEVTKVEISRDVFFILVDLLRKGCTPEAIYLVLHQMSKHSKIIKDLKRDLRLKRNIKPVNNENRPHK